jgi:hypothetical protein
MKADTRVLTKKQMLVYILDAEGNSPTEIGKRVGMTAKRVCNIKARLRQLGFEPAVFRSLRKRLDETSTVPAQRSPLEPEDDELPDADEPAIAVSRCSCGLVLPCYHAPMSAFRNSASYCPDKDADATGSREEW